MVVVALGSPNVPVTTCAEALPPAKKLETASTPSASFRILAPKSIRILLKEYFWVSLRCGRIVMGWFLDRPTKDFHSPRINGRFSAQGLRSRLHFSLVVTETNRLNILQTAYLRHRPNLQHRRLGSGLH